MTTLLALSLGCIRVYQPMSGLHDPIVVDPGARNLEDVSVAVYCVPGKHVNAAESRRLCEVVGTLFENQGAEVVTFTNALGFTLDDGDTVADEEDVVRTDLTVELRAREVHKASRPLSWVLNVMSLTIVPGLSEQTFAQEVVIRDDTGFLLVRDELQGRLVERFGAGVWLGNKFLDFAFREDEDHLAGDAAKEDLSADLYGQLSQLVFDAKLRWMVQQQAAE